MKVEYRKCDKCGMTGKNGDKIYTITTYYSENGISPFHTERDLCETCHDKRSKLLNDFWRTEENNA